MGLLRSEFQYLGRENYPRENELFHAYKKIAETMGDRLAVIRTADLGADKQACISEYPDETNPIMGNREYGFVWTCKKCSRLSCLGYFQGKCIWKSGYYVSHDQL